MYADLLFDVREPPDIAHAFAHRNCHLRMCLAIEHMSAELCASRKLSHNPW